MTTSQSRGGVLGLVLAAGLGVPLIGCSAPPDDRCADGACVATSGEGGPDVGDAGGDAPIDPCIDNPTDAKCLDESTSLFVSSPKGNDQDATGTRDKPFKTLNAALKRIDQAKRRIYVCEGNYPEDIKLDASHASVSIFGGVDCNWNAAPAISPVFGATSAPFKSDGASGVAMSTIALVAKDATAGSSIAAFVRGGSVTLKAVRLSAGRGAPGDDAVLVPFTYPSQPSLDGNMAFDDAGNKKGGLAKTVTCPGGATTTGGAGGDPGAPGGAGEPALGGGGGGLVGDCEINSLGGKKGASGQSAGQAAGATTVGELQQTGWVAADGTAGTIGGPGQGGGGGGGYLGGGGGGGAGGCGGAAGPAGKGGGSSIALAVFEARVTVIESMLEAKSGGRGGHGAVGQLGQTEFGIGGNRNGSACNGGNGGAGGTGGAGGGGAGGSSLGIVYRGQKPEVDVATDARTVISTKGAGGGLANTTSGVDGTEARVLESK